MNHKIHIPTLTTSRLTLRPFSPEDDISLHRIMNEPKMMQYFPNTAPPKMERVQALIERQLMQYQ